MQSNPKYTFVFVLNCFVVPFQTMKGSIQIHIFFLKKIASSKLFLLAAKQAKKNDKLIKICDTFFDCKGGVKCEGFSASCLMVLGKSSLLLLFAINLS